MQEIIDVGYKIFPTETITNADYADDLALLKNTPAQAESLLHRLEQAEFMCFK